MILYHVLYKQPNQGGAMKKNLNREINGLSFLTTEEDYDLIEVPPTREESMEASEDYTVTYSGSNSPGNRFEYPGTPGTIRFSMK
jgi:hypothetical protein